MFLRLLVALAALIFPGFAFAQNTPAFQLYEPYSSELLEDGSALNVGAFAVGQSRDVLLRIRNSGSGNLILPATPIVILGTAISCTAAVITQPPLALLAPGAQQDFMIRVTATEGAGFACQFEIPTNDPIVATFNCALAGTGLAPEIDLQRPIGTSIPSGGTSAVGALPVGQAARLQWAIANTATEHLWLVQPTPVTVGTGVNCAVQVNQPVWASVAPGEVGVVSLDITVFAVGAFSIAVYVASNDADEPSYTFMITGTGMTLAPVLYTHIWIDFGNVGVGSAARQTLVLQNQGTDLLSVTAITFADTFGAFSFEGSDPVSAVPGLPSTGFSLTPGETVYLEFRYEPVSTAGAVHDAALTIVSTTGGQPGTQTIVRLRGRAAKAGKGSDDEENCSTGTGASTAWLAMLGVIAAIAASVRLRRS